MRKPDEIALYAALRSGPWRSYELKHAFNEEQWALFGPRVFTDGRDVFWEAANTLGIPPKRALMLGAKWHRQGLTEGERDWSFYFLPDAPEVLTP